MVDWALKNNHLPTYLSVSPGDPSAKLGLFLLLVVFFPFVAGEEETNERTNERTPSTTGLDDVPRMCTKSPAIFFPSYALLFWLFVGCFGVGFLFLTEAILVKEVCLVFWVSNENTDRSYLVELGRNCACHCSYCWGQKLKSQNFFRFPEVGLIQFSSIQFKNTLILAQGAVPLWRAHEKEKKKAKNITATTDKKCCMSYKE